MIVYALSYTYTLIDTTTEPPFSIPPLTLRNIRPGGGEGEGGGGEGEGEGGGGEGGGGEGMMERQQ